MTKNSTISSQWRGSRASASAAAALAGAAVALAGLLVGSVTHAAEPASCRTVRLADIGWTDVTVTTALLATVLTDLGYEPQVNLLSLPVTYEAMKAGRIDVFLGNWMPSQAQDRRPYLEEGSVEIVRTNLVGAKYTLAVPAYAYDAGLRDFRDIHRYAGPLRRSLYGIEAGNTGNRRLLGMIERDDFGLGGFHLIESSEQGMLAEVERAVADRRPIVFLAWEPHPMNMRFELRYLTGGDTTFGPDFGGATVVTLARRGVLARCPNLARLLRNVEFTTRAESELMLAISEQHVAPESAAAAWLAEHRETRAAWLAGVTRFDGRDAAAGAARSGSGRGVERVLQSHKIPAGEAATRAVDWVKQHGAPAFGAIAAVVGALIAAVGHLLAAVPGPLLIAAAAVLAWLLQRSLPLAGFVAAALLFIMNQGYWQATLETLALVLVAAGAAALIGVPVGIATAHRPRLHAVLRPVLDLMQTLPTFVYLIPTLVLFGLGVVPALISTVIFALPAPIRLTHLGVSGVPRALVEAGEAFGATRWQQLVKIELPSAAPLILAGISQCIMLSLSMVVIAALVGAGGLGVPVVRALSSVQVGMGFEAGLAIVLLAVILDRMLRRRGGAEAPS